MLSHSSKLKEFLHFENISQVYVINILIFVKLVPLDEELELVVKWSLRDIVIELVVKLIEIGSVAV